MNLDETDRVILHILQKEPRTSLSHDDIADRIEVSSSTVGNRIRELKEDGILEGYQPKINYEKAGVPHHILFVCSASITKRKELGEQVAEIDGVINVRELLTGQRNLHVETVCLSVGSIESVAKEIASLGLEIEMSEILRDEHTRPFDNFGEDIRNE